MELCFVDNTALCFVLFVCCFVCVDFVLVCYYCLSIYDDYFYFSVILLNIFVTIQYIRE